MAEDIKTLDDLKGAVGGSGAGAETLVAGIADWQVNRINGSLALSADSLEIEKTHSSLDESVTSYLQLGFSVISLDRQFSAPPLHASQLLAPRR